MSIDLVQSLNAYVNSTPQLVTVIFAMYLFIRWLKGELKEDINKLDTKIDSVRAELKEDINKLDTKIDNVRIELKEDISKLDTKIDSVRAELGNRIDSINTTTNTLIVGLFTKQNNELNKINN